MLSFRDFQRALRELGLTPQSRALVIVSLAGLGPVRGGSEAVLAALAAQCGLVVMPAFTTQCQVVPLVGPENNALDYAAAQAANAEAEIFQPNLPARDPLAEMLRKLPGTARSSHPLLSFVARGAEAESMLSAQTLAEPWGPLAKLAEANGDVVLLGVDQTANVALTYATQHAGRKGFVRWALTAEGVVECPGWPGCTTSFTALDPALLRYARTAYLGPVLTQRIPLRDLFRVTADLLRADRTALLCARPECAYCAAIRAE